MYTTSRGSILHDMDSRPGHRNLRVGRRSLAGQVYLLTTTTAAREPVFGHWNFATAASRTIACKNTWGDAALLCWALMPDHWHGLIRLDERDRLPGVVNRFKSRVAKAVRLEGRADTIWARAYHDHALRRDEDLIAIARYIVLNPVRAGLVRRVGDYAFWDAAWL